jgi:hypothetical protein
VILFCWGEFQFLRGKNPIPTNNHVTCWIEEPEIEILCKEKIIKFEVKIECDKEIYCKIKGKKFKATKNEIWLTKYK